MKNTSPDYCQAIYDFIHILKKEGLLHKLEQCNEFKPLHLYAATKELDKENNYLEYFTTILYRILGQYAYQYYNMDTLHYEFDFLGDGTLTTYFFQHRTHLHQNFKKYLTGSVIPQPRAYPCLKLLALTFYEWCETQQLTKHLIAAFDLPQTTDSNIADELYQKLLNLHDLNTDNTLSTPITLDSTYLLFGDLSFTDGKWNTNLKKYLKNRNIAIDISDRSNTEIWNDLKQIAKKITDQAFQYPTYTYLRERGRISELQELLKISASYSANGVYVGLPISNILNHITEWYTQERREYTFYTLLDIAGELAITASFHSEHIIHPKQLTADSTLVSQIYNDLSSGTVKWITNKKFTIRQYRLVFWGLGQALKYNRMRTAPQQILDDLYKNFKKDMNEQNSNHTEWYFDNILCFTCAMMHKLDDSIRIPLIELFCTSANDFSLPNRKKQVISIYILTYLLYETCDMPQELRKKVFLSTYGRSMYKIQHDSWQQINASSSFYETFARDSFQQACELIDGEYVKQPSSFFFLYGYLHSNLDFETLTPKDSNAYIKNADNLLIYASKLQAQSWFQGNRKPAGKLMDCLKLLSDHLYNRLITAPDDNIMKYVYASHYFCYAISNLYNNKTLDQTILISTDNRLLTIMIYTDFYNRRYHAAYHNARYLEPNHAIFLINAPIRVLCSTRFHHCNSIPLNEGMRKHYKRWLRFETGRYKFLMMRLLSYTDFFENLTKAEKMELLSDCESTLEKTEFLPYDHMPSTPEERALFLKDYKCLFPIK